MFIVVKFSISIVVFIALSYIISVVYAFTLIFIIALFYYDTELEEFGVHKLFKLLLKVRNSKRTKTVHRGRNSQNVTVPAPAMSNLRFNQSSCAYSPIQGLTNGVGKSSAARITSTPLPSLSLRQHRDAALFTPPKMRSTIPSPRYSLSDMSPSTSSNQSRTRIQNVSGPLLASTRYNVNVGTYMDSKSPGLAGRIVQYSNEQRDDRRLPTHQAKYNSPGLFPVVHFFKQETPVISPKPKRVTVRIATPDKSTYTTQEQNRILMESMTNELNNSRRQDVTDSEISTRSVLDALKEISRKRLHAGVDYERDQDISNKRQRRDQTNGTSDYSKRAREESPPQSSMSGTKPVKRMCVIDPVMASFSSSRMYQEYLEKGLKRKADLEAELAEIKLKEAKKSRPKLTNAETQTTQEAFPKELKEITQVFIEPKPKNVVTEKVPEINKIEKKDEPPPVVAFGRTIFNEEQLEINRRNKLATLLGAITGDKPVLLQHKRSTFFDDAAKDEEEKPESDKPKSILSPQNKPKHEKHVTFNLPAAEKLENNNVSAMNAETPKKSSATKDLFEKFSNPDLGKLSPVAADCTKVTDSITSPIAFGNVSASPSLSTPNAVKFPISTSMNKPENAAALSFGVSTVNSTMVISSSFTAKPVSPQQPGGFKFDFDKPAGTAPNNNVVAALPTTASNTGFSSKSTSNAGQTRVASLEASNPSSAMAFNGSVRHNFSTTFGGNAALSDAQPKASLPFGASDVPGFGGNSNAAASIGGTFEAKTTPSSFAANTNMSGFGNSTGSPHNSFMFGNNNNSTAAFTNATAATVASISTAVSAKPAFGAPSTAFGAATSAAPAFGVASTASPAFGGADVAKAAFGVSAAAKPPAFGATSAAFGATSSVTPTFGGNGNSSTTTPAFGGSTAAPPAFGGATATAPAAFGATSTTSLAFGGASTAAPAFGGGASTTTPAFGAASTSPPAFGVASTAAPPFGGASTTTPAFGVASTAAPSFGSASTTASAFGAASTTAPAFGAPSTTTPGFGVAPVSTSASGFGASATPAGFNTSSSFGAANSSTMFGTANTTAGGFGANTTTASVFGKPSTSSSVFGFGTSTSTSTSAFGSNASTGFGSTFGTATTATPAFGANTASFGTPTAQPPAFGSSGGFGTPAVTTTFGQPSPTSSAFAFGAKTTNNNFGATSNTFNTTTSAPSFGNNTPSGFGFGATTTQSPSFGSSAPAFGSTTAQPAFGTTATTTTSSNMFGGGGAATPAFGAAGFGGSSSAGGFGSGNGFAASNPPPAFGAPSNAPFGASGGFGSNNNIAGFSGGGDTTFGKQTAASSFGNTSGFSNNTGAVFPTTQVNTTFGPFNSTPANAASDSVFAFGGTASATVPSQPSGSGVFSFGSDKAKASGFNFSNSPSAAPPAFGASSSSFGATPAVAFGAPANVAPFGAAPAPGFGANTSFNGPAPQFNNVGGGAGMFSIGTGASTGRPPRQQLKAKRRSQI